MPTRVEHAKLRADPRQARLSDLATAVRAFPGGWQAQVIRPDESLPQVLRVSRLGVGGGDISCDLENGSWWFFWSDGRRIASADDMDRSAFAITWVLVSLLGTDRPASPVQDRNRLR